MKPSRIGCVVSLLLGCAVETDANRSDADAEPPKLLAQRVTATVKRSAVRLVHLETEREILIATPEHPFATLEAGWVGAGQLVPGDRIVSAKFGVVRVLSAHEKKLSQPVPVFNLSVNASHAYLVGTDQVLVHNTKCKEKPPRENALTRHTRRLEELDGEIEALKAKLGSAQDKTEIEKSLKELEAERKKVTHRLRARELRDRVRRGEHAPRSQEFLERAEAAFESAKKELEATRGALRELEAQAPRSDAERRAAHTRKVELESTIEQQKSELEEAERIVIWQRRVVEIERSRKAEGERPELERERTELKAKIAAERARMMDRVLKRKRRADPEQRARDVQQVKALRQRRRPRDVLELKERELAELGKQPASASRDQRIAELTEQVEMLKKLDLILKKISSAGSLLTRARQTRTERIGQGKDTKATDERIARLSQELAARKAERNELRAHAVLLRLGGARRRKAPLGVDEARFRELERELERELADPTTIDEARLAQIEREVADTLRDDPETLDDEFFEEIWREAEAEIAEPSNVLSEDPTTDALSDGLNRESEDVNEALRALNEELQRSPSPERVPGVLASLERLSRELAEERRQFESLDIALGTQATALSERLEGPGSSRTIQEIRAQLLHTQAERARIRSEWQERTQARLDEARRHLRDMQRSNSFRDEVIEAELAQQITLLEYELAVPPFKT